MSKPRAANAPGLDSATRVAVIDSHDLYRAGLEKLLSESPGTLCVAAWSSVHAALRQIALVRPDVLLIDSGSGAALRSTIGERLRAVSPPTRIIWLINCHRDHCPSKSRKSRGSPGVASGGDVIAQNPPGAAGCSWCFHFGIAKSSSFAEIAAAIAAVRRIARAARTRTGTTSCAPGSASHGSQVAEQQDRLTLREWQVASSIQRGMSNKQIAREMGIAYSTVKNHVSSILQKLALEHRTQLAVYTMAPQCDVEGGDPVPFSH